MFALGSRYHPPGTSRAMGVGNQTRGAEMVSEEFLSIFGADSLRGIIDKYEIEYNGDRRKKGDMIAAILKDDELSVGAIVSNLSTSSLNDLAEGFGFRPTMSGREDLVNLFCLHFEDFDNVDDDFMERVKDGSLPEAAMEYLGNTEEEHDDYEEDGAALASVRTQRQGGAQTQDFARSAVNAEEGNGFDAYYWFLRAPGKFILWVEYFFPRSGQLWASARRKGNETVEVLYSLGFWAVSIFLLVLLIRSGGR